MTRLPLDFPPLVEMAERAANDVHSAAMLSVFAKYDSVSSSLSPSVVMVDAHARLLSDLTRPESQAVWLRWLARELWRKAGGNRVEPKGTALWGEERCYGLHYIVTWAYGRMNGSYRVSYACSIPGGDPCGRDDLRCPALPNPNSADAPIRALVLAIVTVGAA